MWAAWNQWSFLRSTRVNDYWLWGSSLSTKPHATPAILASASCRSLNTKHRFAIWPQHRARARIWKRCFWLGISAADFLRSEARKLWPGLFGHKCSNLLTLWVIKYLPPSPALVNFALLSKSHIWPETSALKFAAADLEESCEMGKSLVKNGSLHAPVQKCRGTLEVTTC